MRTAWLFILAVLVASPLFGSEVPPRTELTADIMENLGFSVSTQVSSSHVDVEFSYPEVIDGYWQARGTVIHLLSHDNGDTPVVASRSDFLRPSRNPKVVAGFPLVPPENDLAIDVVYHCDVSTGRCGRVTTKHYGIRGFRKFVDASAKE